MDWNGKWDWENLVMFNALSVESPKKQSTDWRIDEEGDIDTGSFNLSGGGGGGSGSDFFSGSDLAHGSSARSSISASTDSSSKEVINTSKIAFQAFHAFPGALSKKNELARSGLAGISSPLESSDVSGEALIGLKLGKRTYFENNCTGGNAKTSSFSVIPAVSSAASVAKKTKSSCQSTAPQRCQVEGCNLDLSSAKDYHRKHRVCESHSKCQKVVVRGLDRRFCQQCSRFHGLSEFDEKKRSCRRRLSDHNARRRKPQQDLTQFNSTRLSSPFLNGRQQMNFVLNNAPLVHTRPSANPTWESTCSSKFTLVKGYELKSEKTVGIDGQLQLPGIELPHAISIPGQNSNRILPPNGPKAEVFAHGLKESMISFNLDAAPDHCALSLLSTDSWGSEPTTIAFDHPFQVNLTSMPQPVMHGVPQGLPLSLSEYWHTDHSTDHRRLHTFTANAGSHFQEIQPFKAAYEGGLYSNLFS